jgi:hypothetical protein
MAGFPVHERPDSSFKDTARQQYPALTTPANDADISTKPDNLPFVTAAGVLFLEADNITQSYFCDHLTYTAGFAR